MFNYITYRKSNASESEVLILKSVALSMIFMIYFLQLNALHLFS